MAFHLVPCLQIRVEWLECAIAFGGGGGQVWDYHEGSKNVDELETHVEGGVESRDGQ